LASKDGGCPFKGRGVGVRQKSRDQLNFGEGLSKKFYHVLTGITGLMFFTSFFKFNPGNSGESMVKGCTFINPEDPLKKGSSGTDNFFTVPKP
jgi:hypothetical protein